MSRARHDRGSVTVELAAALPAVVLVLAMVLSAVAWARACVVAADAAAFGSRIAAVEGTDAAIRAVASVAPGAEVRAATRADGLGVSVTVSTRPVSWLPAASATSSAPVSG